MSSFFWLLCCCTSHFISASHSLFVFALVFKWVYIMVSLLYHTLVHYSTRLHFSGSLLACLYSCLLGPLSATLSTVPCYLCMNSLSLINGILQEQAIKNYNPSQRTAHAKNFISRLNWLYSVHIVQSIRRRLDKNLTHFTLLQGTPPCMHASKHSYNARNSNVHTFRSKNTTDAGK